MTSATARWEKLKGKSSSQSWRIYVMNLGRHGNQISSYNLSPDQTV